MLALAMARARWRTLVGTFIALALGVAVMSTAAIVFASSTAQAPDQYDAAQVLVASGAPEPSGRAGEFKSWSGAEADRLAQRLAELPGVHTAVADRSFPAQLTAGDRVLGTADVREPLGHSWSSLALGRARLTGGSAPLDSHQIVVGQSLGLRVGDTVQLLLPAASRPVEVVGLTDGTGIYVVDRLASTVAAGSQVIGVVADPGQDALVESGVRRLVGTDGLVYAGAGRSMLESAADASDRGVGNQFVVFLGLLAGFVSIFVVATTFAFVVTQRRRELGLLRIVGATPGQLRRTLLAEALVVGLPAAILGAVLGAVAAPSLGRWMVEGHMQAPGWEPRTLAAPMAVSILIGLAVALAGAWTSSRRASRVRPMEALREAAAERRTMTVSRWLCGGACALGAVVLAALTPGQTSGAAGAMSAFASIAAILALTLLAPVYLPTLVRVLCAPFRGSRGATAELVREGAQAGVRRVASTMAPVIVTVGLVVFVTGMTETMDKTIGAGTVSQIPTAQVVAPAEGSPGLTDPALQAVAAAKPAFLGSMLSSHVIIGTSWVTVSGVDEVAAGHFRDSVRAGRLDRLGADTIAVNETVAQQHRLAVGESAPVVWADGTPGAAEVVAVLQDGSPGVLIARGAARRHDPAALTPVAYVDGLDLGRVNPALAPLAARAMTAGSFVTAGDAEEEQLVRLFVLLVLGLSVGYTGLSIANTLVMATADRRREFAVLRLAGATRRQVLRVVVVEAATVVVLGAGLGLVAAVPGVHGIGRWMASDFGVEAAITYDWPVAAATIAACLLIAVVASLLPAWSALRTRAIESVRGQE